MRSLIRRFVFWLLRPVMRPLFSRLRELVKTSVDASLRESDLVKVHELLKEVVNRRENISPLMSRLTAAQLTLDAIRIELQKDREKLARFIEGGSTATAQHLNQISHLQAAQAEVSQVALERADASLQHAVIPIGQELLMRMPEGFVLVPAEDLALVASIWESGGRLEPGVVEVLKAVIRKGDLVVDVGAHIGLITLPAARLVGAAGRVVAVEPAPRAADLLGRSLALNDVSSAVTLHRCAAGEKPGNAVLHLGMPLGHSSLLPLPGSTADEEVEVLPLDDLIAPGTAVRLIKIDAEGFEPEIGKGMRRIVSDNPDLILLIEFGPEHLQRADVPMGDWMNGLVPSGFTAFEIDQWDGSLAPLRSRGELANVHSLNLLIIRESRAGLPALRFKTQTL